MEKRAREEGEQEREKGFVRVLAEGIYLRLMHTQAQGPLASHVLRAECITRAGRAGSRTVCITSPGRTSPVA